MANDKLQSAMMKVLSACEDLIEFTKDGVPAKAKLITTGLKTEPKAKAVKAAPKAKAKAAKPAKVQKTKAKAKAKAASPKAAKPADAAIPPGIQKAMAIVTKHGGSVAREVILGAFETKQQGAAALRHGTHQNYLSVNDGLVTLPS